MNLKKELAERIVADFHLPEAAQKAAEEWGRQFQRHEVPDSAERVSVKLEKVVVATGEGAVNLPTHFRLHEFQTEQNGRRKPAKLKAVRLDKLLVEAGFVNSRTEADRKIKAKAVRVIDQVVPLPLITVFVPSDLVTVLGRKIKIISLLE
jgi:tyrosyl-tRNA synthetase